MHMIRKGQLDRPEGRAMSAASQAPTNEDLPLSATRLNCVELPVMEVTCLRSNQA